MKKGLVLGSILASLLLGGCGFDTEPTPFDSSIQNINPRYDRDGVVEGKFLAAVDSSGKRYKDLSDEELIRYGKAICTLLDETPREDAEKIVDEYDDGQQVISDAAIEHFCPKYLN